MDWKRIYWYIKDNPEWFVLGIIVLLLAGGGAGYYYYSQLQRNNSAQQRFNRLYFFYLQAEAPEQFERVTGQFNRLLGQYPDAEVRDKVLYFLGKSYYRREDYEGAIQNFLEVVRNHHDSIFYDSSRLHAGYCYYHLGRDSEALTQFKKLSELNSDEPIYQEALWQRGLILWEQEEYEKSRQVLNRLIETAPADDTYWVRRARGLLAELPT